MKHIREANKTAIRARRRLFIVPKTWNKTEFEDSCSLLLTCYNLF